MLFSLFILNFLEFGKGLFNEKFDLDLSESEGPLYFNYKKERKTLELINKKEELKQAFSDIIPEDMYFSLD